MSYDDYVAIVVELGDDLPPFTIEQGQRLAGAIVRRISAAIAAEQEACVALLEDEADDWRTAARRTGEQRFHAIAYGLKIAAGKVRNREEC